MNAYELAEQLENMEPYATGDDLTLSNSAAMLRQQADRIAKLEKDRDRLFKAHSAEMVRADKQADRIVELEKLLQESAMNYISICSQADEHYARVQELEKQGEPVAWIRSGDGQLSLVKEKDDGYMVWKPLYLAPQTKPLSDEEITELENALKVCDYKYFGSYAFTDKQWDAFEVLEKHAKAILRKAWD